MNNCFFKITIQSKSILISFFLTVFLIISATTCFSQKERNDEFKKKVQQRGKREKVPGNANTISKVSVSSGNMIIGCPTNNSVTASIILEEDAEGFIEYSTERGKYNNQTAVFKTTNSEPFEINITQLKPNSQYYYRLNYRIAGEKNYSATTESWFATQKNRATSFSFGVQGDSHPEREGKMFHPDLYRQTMKHVAERKPDFYFMLGDDFNIDRLVASNTASCNNVEPVYKVQRYYLGNTGTNPPLFLVNGNHEQAAKYLLNGTPENAAIQAGLARKKFFPLPAPNNFYTGNKDTIQHIGLLKDYYAFEWGNALFVVIDPYWHSEVAVDNPPTAEGNKRKKDPWSITLGKEQYEWLKKTLETSTSKFKFVFAHHVNGTGRGGVERAKYFEWGGYGQDGQWQFDRFRPGWQMPIHQLFVKNKVAIFFQGHDHIFAKQELDGVVYQSVPNPADDTHTAFNKEAYFSGDILPNSGFLHVTVNPGDVKVEYVRSYFMNNSQQNEDAKKSFTYTIKK